MNFVKMHGTGNDYVYVDTFNQTVGDPVALAQRVSERHRGVGSDGLVLIQPSDKAHVRMRMFNSDGSESEMCGNAIRCVGKYAYEYGLAREKVMTVETLAGIKTLWLHLEGERVASATVDMGKPEWQPSLIPLDADAGGEDFLDKSLHVGGKDWRVSCVSMGNPHAVTFVRNVDGLNLPTLGPLFENHALFPQRVNTEWVEVQEQVLRMRVWERGAGETLACGTGACAVAVVAARLGLAPRHVTVALRGGRLDIDWRDDDHVYMSGEAESVFEGRLL